MISNIYMTLIKNCLIFICILIKYPKFTFIFKFISSFIFYIKNTNYIKLEYIYKNNSINYYLSIFNMYIYIYCIFIFHLKNKYNNKQFIKFIYIYLFYCCYYQKNRKIPNKIIKYDVLYDIFFFIMNIIIFSSKIRMQIP